MFASCECCLCIGLIIPPEDSYRMWCIWVPSWTPDNEEASAHWRLLCRDIYIYILRNYSNVLAAQLFLSLWSWIHCTLHLFHLTLCSWCWKIADFPENWSEFYTPPLFIRTGEHSERSSLFFLCLLPSAYQNLLHSLSNNRELSRFKKWLHNSWSLRAVKQSHTSPEDMWLAIIVSFSTFWVQSHRTF